MVSWYWDEKHSHHPVLGMCKRECVGKWLRRGHCCSSPACWVLTFFRLFFSPEYMYTLCMLFQFHSFPILFSDKKFLMSLTEEKLKNSKILSTIIGTAVTILKYLFKDFTL